MTVIPPDQLQAETLRLLVEEFVTRQGAIHGHADVSVELQVSALLRQIQAGDAVIVYDEASESCGVVSKHQLGASQIEQRRNVEEEIEPSFDG